MSTRKHVPLAIALATLMSCGGGGSGGYGTDPGSSNTPPPPNPPGGSSNVVMLNASSFSPASLTVTAGATVTWQWAACADGGYGDGGACPTHSVTLDDGSNESSGIQSTGTFRHTFATAGTYKYHCSVHGASVMSGEIVVQ